MNVVLVNPEIPQNTGNIARTCAATGTMLHLIKPLGFSLEDRYLRRAGLDYWRMMRFHIYECYEDLLKENPKANLYFLTTKASRPYTEAVYGPDDFLVFGCETKGLPERLLHDSYDRCFRIPMVEGARSLNLSNSVAVVLYEGLRKQGFCGLKATGEWTARQGENAAWADHV